MLLRRPHHIDKKFRYRSTQDMRNVNQTTPDQQRTNAIVIIDFFKKINGRMITQLDMTQSHFQLKLDEFE